MISDLDELVLSCRSAVAKTQIQEAVSCYRAGAYRSTIIATWIAVLFDFVSKLRELEMSGDKKAAKCLGDFDKARSSGDVSASLEFERTLVKTARDEYELLSAIEATDLDRLLEDRNRCAHSSMVSMDEPYSPSGELARAHIKTAVAAFLQHPPVQGKAALERIFQDIKSDYFPTDEENAYVFLQSGPLGRARKPLVRSVVIGITKDLLSVFRSQQERARQFAALKAVLRLYPAEFQLALAGILPTIVSGIQDDEFHLTVRYLRQVETAWKPMGQSAQIRTSTYVQSAGAETLVKFLSQALAVDALRETAISRLKDLEPEQIGKLLKIRVDPAFLCQGLELLERSKGYRRSELILEEIVIPLTSFMTSSDLTKLSKCCAANDQVYSAFQTPSLLEQVLENCKLNDIDAQNAWRSIYDLCISKIHFLPEISEGLTSALISRFGFERMTPVSQQPEDELQLEEDIPF